MKALRKSHIIKNAMRSCLNTFLLLSILERKNIPKHPASRDTAEAVMAMILNCKSCGAVKVDVIPGNPSSWLTVVVLICRRAFAFSCGKDDLFDMLKFGGSPSVIILNSKAPLFFFIPYTFDLLFGVIWLLLAASVWVYAHLLVI